MIRFPRTAIFSILASAIALAAVATAAEEAATTDPIVERQKTMEAVGKAMKALGGIARQEAPFDAKVVQQNAATIADRLEHAQSLFPEGSGSGAHETWAKGEIWTNRSDFDSTLKSAHEAAVALATVSDEAAYRPALGKLGQNCRNCHDSFRRPKD